MGAEVRYFVLDGQQKNGVEILHFDRLYLAIRAYKALPMTSRKVLGVQAEGRSANLARCVPVYPGDEEGEDVIALDFLRDGFGDARPTLIKAAQDLADCLRVRYCLYRGCLLQVPTKQTLPKGQFVPRRVQTAVSFGGQQQYLPAGAAAERPQPDGGRALLLPGRDAVGIYAAGTLYQGAADLERR